MVTIVVSSLIVAVSSSLEELPSVSFEASFEASFEMD
jgi:hypothetical protein